MDESKTAWLERVYRLAAEAECMPVMVAIHDRYRFMRPPEDELRLVRNVRKGREKEALNA